MHGAETAIRVRQQLRKLFARSCSCGGICAHHLGRKTHAASVFRKRVCQHTYVYGMMDCMAVWHHVTGIVMQHCLLVYLEGAWHAATFSCSMERSAAVCVSV